MSHMQRLPLEGYRVSDMTEVWAGPLANSLLGDLGAEVIKVESYPRVVQTRPVQAPAGAASGVGGGVGPPDAPRLWERSPLYHIANRNKLAVALNASDPRGLDIVYRLVASADAFLIGDTAGTAARMGLDYDTLLPHPARPALAWVMNNGGDQPIGNVDPETAPNGCYPCVDPDSWVVIVVRSDDEWRALQGAMGNPTWADSTAFDSVLGRVGARPGM